MMVSERRHNKDVKVKTFLKYAYLLKRYSVLKVQFSTILLLKIVQNGGKMLHLLTGKAYLKMFSLLTSL